MDDGTSSFLSWNSYPQGRCDPPTAAFKPTWELHYSPLSSEDIRKNFEKVKF